MSSIIKRAGNFNFLGSGSGIDSKAIILCGFLILQLVAALAMKLAETRYQPFEATSKLLTCDVDTASKIVISESDGEGKEAKEKSSLVLERSGAGWILPDRYAAPVKRAAVEALLNELKSAKTGFPISTTSGSIDRFKVGERKFLHRISLLKDKQNIATVFFGDSPAFRQVYARISSSDNIYDLEFPSYLLLTDSSEWIDRQMSAVPLGQVSSIDMGSYTLQKSGSNWTLNLAGKQTPISRQSASQLLDKLSDLTVNSVISPQEGSTCSSQPCLSYRAVLVGGKTIDYKFFKPDGKDYAVLKVSDKPFYMQVDWQTVASIRNVNAGTLLSKPAEPVTSKSPVRGVAKLKH